MESTMEQNIKDALAISLMAAFIIAGAFIRIPLEGPVPVVIQNLFILLAGLLLGPWKASAAIGLFLFLGFMGLPVFAGGKSGPGLFAGPTAGFLLGYLCSGFLAGLISHLGKKTSLGKDILAVLAGSLVIYCFGVFWLVVFIMKGDWTKALTAGVLPFILWDSLKAGAAILTVQAIRPFYGKRE